MAQGEIYHAGVIDTMGKEYSYAILNRTDKSIPNPIPLLFCENQEHAYVSYLRTF